MAPKRERKTPGDSFPEGFVWMGENKIQVGGDRRAGLILIYTAPTALNLGGNCLGQDFREEMALILPTVKPHV